MGVYRIMPAEGHLQFLVASGLEAAERLATLPTNHFRSDEPAVEVDLVVRDPERGALQPVELPWLSSNVPAHTTEAATQLAPILGGSGRFIPLASLYGEFFGFDVHVALDALDLAESDVIRFPSSGRIMDIDKHVFLPEVVGDAPIFSLSTFERAGWTYVTPEYVKAVHDAGLEGVDFEPVWSGDD